MKELHFFKQVNIQFQRLFTGFWKIAKVFPLIYSLAEMFIYTKIALIY